MTYHDKRLIGGSGEINNLMPAKYQWAWKMVMDSIANVWFHHQTSMDRDKPHFDTALSPAEKETFLNVFATLTTSDMVILRNIAACIVRHITAPEVGLYLTRQIGEEGVHCYCEDTEILTQNGWKLFKNLTHDDHVFEYKGVGYLNTYSKPKHIIQSDYKGPMYYFTGEKVNLLVTPEHRMVYLENGDPNKLRVALAKDFDPKNNPIILNKPLDMIDPVGEIGIIDNVSVIEYSGTIHCVSVDSGMVCVRRLGQQAICGNSITYQHVIEILCLDEDSIYSRYLTIPEINQKFVYAKFMSDKIDRFEDVDSLLEGLIFYYLIFEGIWFYNGFSPIYSLGRRNILPGTNTQLQYIMRDEANHVAFGIKLIKGIFAENHRIDQDRIHAIFKKGIELEEVYAKRTIADMLGYNANVHVEQAKYLANRRLRQIGCDILYPEAQNVLPWLDEMVNINKEKNFFETHVTEYQSAASLVWDD